MNCKLTMIAFASVALLVLGAAPVEKVAPVQTRAVVLYSLQVLLPAPTTDQKEVQAFAKHLLEQLQKHFGEANGISPTQFSTGLMPASGRWREVIIHFAVNEKLGDDAVVATFKSFPFKTTTILNKATTTTEVFEIRVP